MKIGILTYHRTLNYGGCLQALATRLILEKMGHEVFYVDYWPKYHKQSYSIISLHLLMNSQTWKSGIRTLLEFVFHMPYSIKRRKNFLHFIKKEIVPFCKPLSEEYDAIIYGSDQIWRKQPITNDYNPVYFAKNDFPTKKHIAFSVSMGILPTNVDDINKVKEYCHHFDRISVRENNLCSFLKDLGFHNTCVSLDPTLLVPQHKWDACINSTHYYGSRYILFYELNTGTFDVKMVRQFAVERGLSLKVIKGYADKKDSDTEITTAGPYEFVKWIRNADFVFSSSFHGLAFSIIYKKDVFVSFRTNADRAKSLLNMAGIQERFIEPGHEIPKLPPIDYEKVDRCLSIHRQASLDYLNSIRNV